MCHSCPIVRRKCSTFDGLRLAACRTKKKRLHTYEQAYRQTRPCGHVHRRCSSPARRRRVAVDSCAGRSAKIDQDVQPPARNQIMRGSLRESRHALTWKRRRRPRGCRNCRDHSVAPNPMATASCPARAPSSSPGVHATRMGRNRLLRLNHRGTRDGGRFASMGRTSATPFSPYSAASCAPVKRRSLSKISGVERTGNISQEELARDGEVRNLG